MDNKKKQFIIQLLRRGTYKWYGRWTAEKRSKLQERNTYFCENCGVIGGKKDFQMDHILPIVDPEKGFETFDKYIDRMFCEAVGFMRLCLSCHETKTNHENSIRKETRSKRTKKKLDKE